MRHRRRPMDRRRNEINERPNDRHLCATRLTISLINRSSSMFIVCVCLGLVLTAASHSSYLIDVDSSWNSVDCSTLFDGADLHRIPRLCHWHLLCSPSSCDDSSFRCVKLRETLCCVEQFIRRSCPVADLRRLKARFRSFYFDVSIEDGYCEINLERIEREDRSYCIASSHRSSSVTPHVDWVLFGRHLASASFSSSFDRSPHDLLLPMFLIVFSFSI